MPLQQGLSEKRAPAPHLINITPFPLPPSLPCCVPPKHFCKMRAELMQNACRKGMHLTPAPFAPPAQQQLSLPQWLQHE